MISDWSGVAIEYAFSLEKPVLYVDIPKKMNNSDYKNLEIVPLEEKIRTQIGVIISPLELSNLSSKIENLCSGNDQTRKKIQAIREETVFNLGKSEKYGTKYLLEFLARKNEQEDNLMTSFTEIVVITKSGFFTIFLNYSHV